MVVAAAVEFSDCLPRKAFPLFFPWTVSNPTLSFLSSAPRSHAWPWHNLSLHSSFNSRNSVSQTSPEAWDMIWFSNNLCVLITAFLPRLQVSGGQRLYLIVHRIRQICSELQTLCLLKPGWDCLESPSLILRKAWAPARVFRHSQGTDIFMNRLSPSSYQQSQFIYTLILLIGATPSLP